MLSFSLLLLIMTKSDAFDPACCPANDLGCTCIGRNQVECDGQEPKNKRVWPMFKRVPNYCRFRFKSLELRDYLIHDSESSPTFNFHHYPIETLRLSYNSMKLRYGHIFQGPCENSTKHLHILGSKFAEVPTKAIAKLKHLESLFIESVKIVVPLSFRHLEGLEFLGLANLHGFLQLYPRAFEGLPHLKRLVLHPTDVILFQENSLSGLSRLSSFHLSLLVGSDLSEELSQLQSLNSIMVEVIYPHEWTPNYRMTQKCFNLIPFKCTMFPRLHHVVIKNGICVDLLRRLICKRPINQVTLELFVPKEIAEEIVGTVEVDLQDMAVHNLSIEAYQRSPRHTRIRDSLQSAFQNGTDEKSASVKLRANQNLRQLTYSYPAALNLSFIAKTPQLQHLTISSAADLLPLGLMKLTHLRSLHFSHLDQFASITCNCSNFWITRYPRWEHIVEPQVKCQSQTNMTFREFLIQSLKSGKCANALELSFRHTENLAYDLELTKDESVELPEQVANSQETLVGNLWLFHVLSLAFSYLLHLM